METKRKNQNKPLKYDEIEKIASYCPFCNTSFFPKKASVIGESNESWLLHVNCDHCASSIVLLLLISEVGVSSFGLVTDLTGNDVMRFKGSSGLEADDLINLYEILFLSKKDILNFI